MDKRSKLTNEQKACIVKCYRAGGVSLLTLAERFGVSRERIGQIVQDAEAEDPTEGGLQTMRSRPLAERFWEKVRKNGPGTPEDRCWDWVGGHGGGGYGVIEADGVKRMATHVAVFLADGVWPPPGAVVRHTCDRPCCIRRSHLIVGTQAENIQDAVQKGRHQGRPVKKLAIDPNYKKPGMKGEKNPMHVLTDEQVVEIRERYADRENTKVTERSLAEAAGVNQSTIHKLLNGELRPNAGGPLVRAGGVHSAKREEIRQLAGDILQMLRDGMSLNKVAKIVGVAKQTIQKELAEELKTVPIRRVNWNERPKPGLTSHVN